MRFGPVPVEASLGGIVAHSVRRGEFVLKKGETIAPAHLMALAAAGVAEITVALLEPDDLGEDATAVMLAQKLAGPGLRIDPPFTGRANLFAVHAGVLVLKTGGIDAINAIDERVTVATLPPMRAVVAGEMVGTVKIIPFAVPRAIVEQVLAVASPIRIAPYVQRRVGVISTLLPGLKPTVIAKTLRVLETRLASMGAGVAVHREVKHETQVLSKAVAEMALECDLLLIFGASAITDRRDVIPSAIVAAGGEIEHFGMPVDPGNLLLLARLGSRVDVIGAPGCARSPKENGFDFVLQRLMAGLLVRGADIRRMGAGGLMMEIISRPQPRMGEAPVDEHE